MKAGGHTSRRRAAVALLALLVAGGAVGVVWAVRAARQSGAQDALLLRCGLVAEGDAAADVFERLGLDGYRPGCGHVTPCQEVDIGPYHDVPWLCDSTDCSLLWRIGTVSCFVDLDPDTRRVLDVDVMDPSEVL